MKNNWALCQCKLVLKNWWAKNIIATSIVFAILGSTPIFSNTKAEEENAAIIPKTTLIAIRNANQRDGKPAYVCSPAGFGQKSVCYLR